MSILKSFSASILAATCLVALPGIAVAGPASIFDLPNDVTTNYFEIFAETDGSPIPCLDPDASRSCDNDEFLYTDFQAEDFDAAAQTVVGTIYYDEQDSQNRLAQAVVWLPAEGKFVLLEDELGSIDEGAESIFEHFDLSTDDVQSPEYDTFATDVNAGGTRVVGLAEGNYDFDWALPLFWDKGVDGWTTARILPTGEGIDAGAALAISDNVPAGEEVEYIAGYTGNTSLSIGRVASVPTDLFQTQATLWEPDADGWTPRRLGLLDEEEDDLSVANDVNDKGQVVGWSGESDSFKRTVDLNWDWDWSNLATPRPFAYDNADDGMVALDVVELDAGEARAISNSGNLAVGWVAVGGPQLAAAWSNDSEDWQDNSLILLHDALTGFGEDLAGSAANAVNEDGTLVVGHALVDNGSPEQKAFETSPVAVYWQLDEEGNVVAGESIEAALQDAGVPLDDADLHLTDATAVRTVTDPETGEISEIYVAGTGEGSFGSWISSLKSAGLTTPKSVFRSVRVVHDTARSLAGDFSVFSDAQYCRRPTGQSVDVAPWCTFVAGQGSVYGLKDGSGSVLGSQFGIARYIDEDTSFGMSSGIAVSQGEVTGGSTYKTLSGMVGFYANHEPKTGLQGRVSVSLGKVLSATFDRVYVNGTGTATSTGTTSGYGADLLARLGYATLLDDATRVIPYLEANLSSVHLDGFSDTGGPFNATFSPIDARGASVKLGVDVERELSATQMVFGGVAVSASGGSGTGTTAVIAGSPFSIAPQGWHAIVSGNIGTIIQLDSSSSFTARVGAATDFSGYVAANALVKYSKTF